MEFVPIPPPKTDRYQVRFWSTGELYQRFCDRLSKDGFKISYLFNQFMEQYASRPEDPPTPREEKCPPHRWDSSGERCEVCGGKDWMT